MVNPSSVDRDWADVPSGSEVGIGLMDLLLEKQEQDAAVAVEHAVLSETENIVTSLAPVVEGVILEEKSEK